MDGNTTHSDAYTYPVARACFGSQYGIGVKGVMIIMYIPYYFDFFVRNYPVVDQIAC